MNQLQCPKCGEKFQIDEAGYAAILKQVRDREFLKEIESREQQYLYEKKQAVQVAVLEAEKDFNSELTQKDAEITKLMAQIKENELIKASAVKDKEAEKDKEIAELKSQLMTYEKDKKLELNELETKLNGKISEKDKNIEALKNQQAITEREYLLKEQSIIQTYEAQLKMKEETIEQYKDFKARLSTKMIGESLEQHCEMEFNKNRALGFQNAYFEKDNDASGGTKGDYIFRETDCEGGEVLSIMFEMKNESDTTGAKKKNEDFFAKLDKDRKNKNCEYAVLVSLLEPENEYYNEGIVDVSHRYEKMYVIRPQFFIPIITILRNASLRSLEVKKELALIKAQNLDISNFERDMNDFKTKFFNNMKDASARFDDAIKGIDKTIDTLKKIKDALLKSESHLNSANKKVEELSIKKLTKNNPTMKAKFDALKLSDKKTQSKSKNNT